MKQDVLIINSYAGSLTIAASQLGLKIRGSYEDSGFGIAAQKLNYPGLNYVDQLPWPKDDLSKSIVIAHPPCAPFSNMSAKACGVEDDGFQCHRDVMNYALGSGCRMLAIESVPGVLKAADEYAAAAKKYDYYHFFLRLNSIGFGVPQWRPRIWILFSKQAHFGVNYQPVYKPLSTIVQAQGTSVERGGEVHIIIRRLKEAKVSAAMLKNIFEGEYGSGSILQIGQRVLEIDDPGTNFSEIRKRWNLGGLFAAMMPRVLDETRWAPTVLGGSSWFIHGRPLFLEEFNAIMGFPVDYKWPANFTDPRLYLSKGVCPPVAKWILEQMAEPFNEKKVYTSFISAGETLDLNPKKETVENILDGKPADPLKIRNPRKKYSRKERVVERVSRSAAEQSKSFLDSLE